MRIIYPAEIIKGDKKKRIFFDSIEEASNAFSLYKSSLDFEDKSISILCNGDGNIKYIKNGKVYSIKFEDPVQVYSSYREFSSMSSLYGIDWEDCV